eukprot:6392798-Heterocapsa_arctica.AAC.1
MHHKAILFPLLRQAFLSPETAWTAKLIQGLSMHKFMHTCMCITRDMVLSTYMTEDPVCRMHVCYTLQAGYDL